MSTTQLPDPQTLTGSRRYVETAEQLLDVTLTTEQQRILTALADHDRVHVMSGNGVGKSFVAAIANGAFLARHPDSICMATSGTYSVLNDTIWKPLRRIWRRSSLPGRTLANPPRIRVDDEWYFKAVAPRHPGNLEGRHAGQMLVTIEEVDKPDITREHFDSAESMLTGGNDRLLAISNPPVDESNVAHDLLRSDRWHTIRFSSFDSHNVRVDAGVIDADTIPGLVGLDTLEQDWETWNDEPWPGLEQARTAHERRDDLDQRWYRRRAGVVPPAGAGVHRPLSPDLVDAGYQPNTEPPRETPESLGIDVARSGDDTVAAGPHIDHLVVHYDEQGTDHTQQESDLADCLREWPSPPVAVDAVGEGSGLADGLDDRFGTVTRYKSNAEAVDGTEYDRCWGESLALFNDYLAAGGTFSDADLYEQAKVAARTVTWTERTLAGRGEDGAQVLSASSKDEVKDRLGRSPDHLDATLMAVWMRDADRDEGVDPNTAFSMEM